MPTVDELRAQLKAVEAAERASGDAELETILVNYEWRVTWKGAYCFRVECRPDETTQILWSQWRSSNPRSIAWKSRMAEPRWHGMEYVLAYTKDGKPLIFGASGGSLILHATSSPDPFSHEPRVITQAQADDFLAGRVPEELKKPW